MRQSRARTLPYRLDEAREEESDNGGREAVDAERPYNERLNGYK